MNNIDEAIDRIYMQKSSYFVENKRIFSFFLLSRKIGLVGCI